MLALSASPSVGAATPAAGSVDRLSYLLLLSPLVGITLLSKFAIPLGKDQLAGSLIVLAATIAFGLSTGRFELAPRHTTFFLCALSLMLATQAVGGQEFSLASMALLIVLHAAYLVRLRSPPTSNETLYLYQCVMVAIGVLGVAQFAAQFVLGKTIAFPMENLQGASYFQNGFNNLIPLRYGSSVFKSNGVFLLEPSFLSQFMAIALIVEIAVFRRPWRMALFAIALLSSYSGTGIVMLACALPFLMTLRRALFLLAGAAVGACVLVFADAFDIRMLSGRLEALDIDAFTNRITEIEDPSSSAFMRFVGIGLLIEQYVLTDVWFTFFGRGAGSIFQFSAGAQASAHDPTWGKIFFEYGLVGFLAYMGFMLHVILSPRRPRSLKFAMLVQFLFLGGFAVSPYAHALIAALLVWTDRPDAEPEAWAAGPARTARSTTVAAA